MTTNLPVETLAAINKFEQRLIDNNTHLIDQVDKYFIDKEMLMQRIGYSLMSVFEERCSRTGRRIATWMFNKQINKFILNQSFN